MNHSDGPDEFLEIIPCTHNKICYKAGLISYKWISGQEFKTYPLFSYCESCHARQPYWDSKVMERVI